MCAFFFCWSVPIISCCVICLFAERITEKRRKNVALVVFYVKLTIEQPNGVSFGDPSEVGCVRSFLLVFFHG